MALISTPVAIRLIMVGSKTDSDRASGHDVVERR